MREAITLNDRTKGLLIGLGLGAVALVGLLGKIGCAIKDAVLEEYDRRMG